MDYNSQELSQIDTCTNFANTLWAVKYNEIQELNELQVGSRWDKITNQVQE